MNVEAHAYRVMIIEDQITPEEIDQAFADDRALGDPSEPCLVRAGEIARNEDDAIEQLDEMGPALPDAIVLDDYLPAEGNTTASRSTQVMSWLCSQMIANDVPLHRRPRCVLWTACEPQLTYTFCSLGGLQYADKRWTNGQQLPTEAIWKALDGRRWQPDPYPAGLNPCQRAPLPWLEAGWLQKNIAIKLKHLGVTEDTMEGAREAIQKMPRTPRNHDSHNARWPMALRDAMANGWVWVPLPKHQHIPSGAPLPLVIDPDAHRERVDPAGPMPARHRT